MAVVTSRRLATTQQEQRKRRRRDEDEDVADLAEQNLGRDDLGEDQRRTDGKCDRRSAERTSA